eukprot:2203157-Amphidinium_carterae.1
MCVLWGLCHESDKAELRVFACTCGPPWSKSLTSSFAGAQKVRAATPSPPASPATPIRVPTQEQAA